MTDIDADALEETEEPEPTRAERKTIRRLRAETAFLRTALEHIEIYAMQHADERGMAWVLQRAQTAILQSREM